MILISFVSLKNKSSSLNLKIQGGMENGLKYVSSNTSTSLKTLLKN